MKLSPFARATSKPLVGMWNVLTSDGGSDALRQSGLIISIFFCYPFVHSNFFAATDISTAVECIV